MHVCRRVVSCRERVGVVGSVLLGLHVVAVGRVVVPCRVVSCRERVGVGGGSLLLGLRVVALVVSSCRVMS